jgi:hypothetical protein
MNLPHAVRKRMPVRAILLASLASIAASWDAVAAASKALPAPGTLGRITAIEQAIETTAASVSLPATASGAMLVTPCPVCAPLSLKTVPRSEWRLGTRVADFAAVRAAVVAKPGAQVLVIYRSHSLELVRLVAYVR